MPVEQLQQLLNARDIRYVRISHAPAYTAQEIAASAHIPGKKMVKTVVINVDGQYALAALPAMYDVDLDRLRTALGARRVTMADETAFRDLFPDCEVGAMPPVGTLYGLPTFMEATLAEDDELAFNAGTHTEVIRISYPDYVRIAEPVELQFALQPA